LPPILKLACFLQANGGCIILLRATPHEEAEGIVAATLGMAHGGIILKEMAMIINSQNLHKTGRLERNIAGARRCR
jgi:hypothetical protein